MQETRCKAHKKQVLHIKNRTHIEIGTANVNLIIIKVSLNRARRSKIMKIQQIKVTKLKYGLKKQL